MGVRYTLLEADIGIILPFYFQHALTAWCGIAAELFSELNQILTGSLDSTGHPVTHTPDKAAPKFRASRCQAVLAHCAVSMTISLIPLVREGGLSRSSSSITQAAMHRNPDSF